VPDVPKAAEEARASAIPPLVPVAREIMDTALPLKCCNE
jgi:hypothetical protein